LNKLFVLITRFLQIILLIIVHSIDKIVAIILTHIINMENIKKLANYLNISLKIKPNNNTKKPDRILKHINEKKRDVI